VAIVNVVTKWAAGGLLTLVLFGPSAVTAEAKPDTQPQARHEVYPVPPGGTFTFHGRGYGHGHGMSQWGAYGAAKVAHLSANQILHFYYPHTKLATKSTKREIRVLLTAANAPGRGYVEVKPADGLAVTPVGGGDTALLRTKTKKGHRIKAWRLRRDGADVDVQERFGGRWHTVDQVAGGATFTDTDGLIRVFLPGRKVRFRGALTGEIENGVMEAVNTVNLEAYLQGVVPAEMPASWSPAALQAQAVAARTYATRGRANPKAAWFDVYGDTRDQAYGGFASEVTQTTKAIQHTAGEVIVDHAGHAILAQYSSANGGWTLSGGVNYLPSQHDPYDGLVPNDAHAWTTTVTAGRLESAYPSVGTLREIVVSERDGNGLWGGRVAAVSLTGSGGTVQLSGTALQLALGLRSPWFRPTPVPAAPSALQATATGRTVTAKWKPPDSVRGAARVTGYRFRLTPGRHKKLLAASTRTVSVDKLPRGTYTVRVVALSSAGAGPPATVVVKTAHK